MPAAAPGVGGAPAVPFCAPPEARPPPRLRGSGVPLVGEGAARTQGVSRALEQAAVWTEKQGARRSEANKRTLGRLRALAAHIARAPPPGAPPADALVVDIVAKHQKRTAAAATAAKTTTAVGPYRQSPAPTPANNAGALAVVGTTPRSTALEAHRQATLARRRHRKRLARIVADQWLHVAQHRISALRVTKFAKRRAWRLWRAATQDSAANEARGQPMCGLTGLVL